MRAKRWNSRWTGVGRASVAVAGVCLTGSVASAWTTTRAADIETEFEAGNELAAGADVTADAPAPAAVNAVGRILAADAGTTVWEQTLVSYLDKIVARDCDEAEGAKASAGEPEVAAKAKANDDADWDIADLEPAAAPAVVPIAEPEDADGDLAEAPAPGEAAEAVELVAADTDWDLEEAPAVAAVNPDWDLEDGPAVAAVNPDWDLEEGPVAVVDADWDLEESAPAVATIDPDWDLAGTILVAVPPSADWDLDEPNGEDAVAAVAREAADPEAAPAAEENADWDLEGYTVASASPEEVGKVDAADDELDLYP